MSKMKCIAFVASVAAVSLGSTAGQAQQPPPQSPNMTFFVTSTGPGKGADLGGLDGDTPARVFVETQDRKIGEMSGAPRGRIKTIRRSRKA